MNNEENAEHLQACRRPFLEGVSALDRPHENGAEDGRSDTDDGRDQCRDRKGWIRGESAITGLSSTSIAGFKENATCAMAVAQRVAEAIAHAMRKE